MIRTRDYFLWLLVVAFAVITTGHILIKQFVDSGDELPPQPEFVTTTSTQGAVVSNQDDMMSRAERLALLRQKILVGGEIISAKPESEAVAEAETDEDKDIPESAGEIRCSNYQKVTSAWQSHGVVNEFREGARVYYRLTTTAPVASSSSSVATVTEEIVAQLPAPFSIPKNQNCIASDVIGIATNGALIKNSDIEFYKIFSASTLVGYALDGYPVYGSGTGVRDACGGVVVNNQYRYQISSEAKTIINCYAGKSIQL